MSRFRLPASLLIVLLLSSASWGQLLTRLVDGRESPIPGMVTFGKSGTRSAKLLLHFRAKTCPAALIITRNAKGILNLYTPCQKTRLSLPVAFSEGFEGIEQKGKLQKGYSVQAAEYDFTGDKDPEIVVAVGDGLVNLEVHIFQYRAPKDAKETGAWKRIGSFSGQSKALLEKASVILPYGSQGLFEQQEWKGDRFVETN